MAGYDYMRGAMDAQFVQDMAGLGSGNLVAQLQARIAKLVENSHQWEANYNKLAAKLRAAELEVKQRAEDVWGPHGSYYAVMTKLDETEKALIERTAQAQSLAAWGATILVEAELCRENPAIEPVFSALGEANQAERNRLGVAFLEAARRSKGTVKVQWLTYEELLAYHKARSEGIEQPDFNR